VWIKKIGVFVVIPYQPSIGKTLHASEKTSGNQFQPSLPLVFFVNSIANHQLRL
jgi:hypothetical protein